MSGWMMPEWMKPHQELFGTSPCGLEIERLMTIWSDSDALASVKFSNSLLYACVLMTAAKAELLMELHRRGRLAEPEPVPVPVPYDDGLPRVRHRGL